VAKPVDAGAPGAAVEIVDALAATGGCGQAVSGDAGLAGAACGAGRARLFAGAVAATTLRAALVVELADRHGAGLTASRQTAGVAAALRVALAGRARDAARAASAAGAAGAGHAAGSAVGIPAAVRAGAPGTAAS
jgi:hypothetical protein